MYATKDRYGNSFKWSRKGKNRECEVRDNRCVVRKCFNPDDCGTVDPKTQQKRIRGVCRNLFEGKCPENYNDPKNFVTYNEKSGKKR